ncbi:non-homologous end-joining DNA ligase [Nonomuraea sp. NPDC050536]|uniref:non-homologous end-joining DNA ligase n=1 Tax=Nonomuraea sp. NPDC050536 TaxID=3364366 RepID=UPI0037C6BED4
MALPYYAPMLAQAGPLPSGDHEDDWAVEMKWDGVRALAYVEDQALRLVSRNRRDITLAYPELYALAGAVGGHDVVLDGEIIAFDADGQPSFSSLQPRMHLRRQARIAELVSQVPVTYMAFDVLHVNAAPAVRMPYDDRRALLKDIVRPGYRWQVPVEFPGQPERALQASMQLGLEGVVCKRRTSPYRPGRRSADWTKVKNISTVAVVVGGWTPGGGRRRDAIGSLLVGAYDAELRLVYAGHVGSGFTERMLADLRAELAPLERQACPFAHVPREHARHAHWVEPVLVGEVAYADVTAGGRLRHPAWRGVRSDQAPYEVSTAQWADGGGSGAATAS